MVGGSTGAAIAYAAAQSAFSNYLNTFMRYDPNYIQSDGTIGGFNPAKGGNPNDPTGVDQNAYLKFSVPGSILNNITYAPVQKDKESEPAYEARVSAWMLTVVNANFNAVHGAGPLNGQGPPQAGSCTLQSQGISPCAYSCAGFPGSGGINFTSDLSGLLKSCGFSSTAAQCPSQLIIKGLTPTNGTILSCTP